MTPEERDEFMRKFDPAWPRPVEKDNRGFWADMLKPLTFDRAMTALIACINTNRTRPAWSEFKAAYDTARGHGRAMSRPACGMCDNGFVDVTPESERPALIGTVMACPNGCRPMSHEERTEHNRLEDRAWRLSMDPARVSDAVAVTARSFSEPEERF